MLPVGSIIGFLLLVKPDWRTRDHLVFFSLETLRNQVNGAAVEDQNPALSLLHLKVKVGDVHGQEVAVAPVEMYFFELWFCFKWNHELKLLHSFSSKKNLLHLWKVRQFWYSLIFTEMSSICQLFGFVTAISEHVLFDPFFACLNSIILAFFPLLVCHWNKKWRT